jgi:hypothetical protein
MIANFINNIYKAKHCLCNPFPINLHRATKPFQFVVIAMLLLILSNFSKFLKPLVNQGVLCLFKGCFTSRPFGATKHSYSHSG